MIIVIPSHNILPLHEWKNGETNLDQLHTTTLAAKGSTPGCKLLCYQQPLIRSFTGMPQHHPLDGTPPLPDVTTSYYGPEFAPTYRTCVLENQVLVPDGLRNHDTVRDFLFLLVVDEVPSLREQVAVCFMLKTDVSSVVESPSESKRDNKSSFMNVNTTGCPSGSGSISFSTGKRTSYILGVGMSTCKFVHGTHTSSKYTNEPHSHPFGGTQINGDIILDGSDTLTPHPPNIWRRLSFRMRKVVHLTGILIGNSVEITPCRDYNSHLAKLLLRHILFIVGLWRVINTT